MKILLFALLIANHALALGNEKLRAIGSFNSLDDFTKAVHAADLKDRNIPLAGFFVVAPPKTPDTPIPVDTIATCALVWEHADEAWVFATASIRGKPKAGRVGILFLLARIAGSWVVADTKGVTATIGKRSLTCVRVGPQGTWLQTKGADQGDMMFNSHGYLIQLVDVE